MQTNQKKVVKVTFKGDMKRLKMTQDYKTLVEQTHKAFGEGVIPKEFKYFYMDEDNEMISINSQNDLEEALSNEDLGILKLIASTSVQEAREQLCQDISDTISMRESLNQSGFFTSPVQEMARLDLNSQPSGTSILATERAPIMRSAFEDDFEALEHSTKLEPVYTKEEAPEVEEQFICVRPVDPVEMAPVEVFEQKQELPIVEEIKMDKKVKDKKRNQKCERKSCMFGRHPKQKHGWCCASCKNDGCHGKACLKLQWENKQVAESEHSNEEIQDKDNGESTEEVASQVRDDVRDFCRQAFSGMLSNFLQDKRVKQSQVEHEGFECDGCAVNPIKGVRFKCSVCPDYDLCESCEAKGLHAEHPMLKIRDPSMAPVKLICQYVDIAPHVDAIKVPVEKPKQQAHCGKKSFIKYSGRFVKESFGDKYVVMPGEKIRKSWTFRNDGKTSWPEDTLFIQTNGDNMNSSPVALTAAINSDSEHTWEVELTAPQKEGRYQCYFRMVTGNNYRFGHKVWADILVQAPQIVDEASVPMKEVQVIVDEPMEEVKVEEPEVMVCDFIAESVADFKAREEADKPDQYPVIEIEESGDKAGAEESPLNVSIKVAGLVTPKEIYNKKCEEIEVVLLKQSLTDLFELGFVNFEVNKALLEKYDNDTQAVANLLCEGALSESCIAQVFKN